MERASADETVYREDEHVGTDAFVRPPKQSEGESSVDVETAASAVSRSEARPTDVAPTTHSAPHVEATPIAHQSKPVRLKPGQAPWPTPPLRILVMRKGIRFDGGFPILARFLATV